MTDQPMEPLTDEQIIFVRNATSRWLRLRGQHESLEHRLSVTSAKLTTDDKKLLLTQLAADVDHSALLWRLLAGKEPLPEPPPTEYSYPVYPPDE